MADKNKIWLKNIFRGEARRFRVLSHTNPDGDALGSSLALAMALRKWGHDATVIVPDSFPGYYNWMPGCNEIVIAEKKAEQAATLIKNADFLVFADLNDIKRVKQLEGAVRESVAQRILIDHHLSPKNEFDYAVSKIETSSTSELVYEILAETDESVLDIAIGECLYTGIATDTGTFFHSCKYPSTFEVTAKLIRLGVDNVKINQLVYNTYSENRLRLLGYSLFDKMKVIHKHKSAYMALNKDELRKFHYATGDTEGIVNYGLSIKGISVSAIFLEMKENIKISFRSEGNYDVNALARKYYEGGGHKNASGAFFYGSLKDAVALFEKAVSNEF